MQAYQLRLGGKLPSEIAVLLGYADTAEVVRVLNEEFRIDSSYLTQQTRESLLSLEVARLEALLGAVWPSAMMGDPKSVHEAADLVMKEARITGLEQIDPVVNKNLVLVMGDKEEDYIAALRAVKAND